MKDKAKKPLPRFKTDKEAENFVDAADLTQFDLSGEVMSFELEEKSIISEDE